MQNRDFYEHDYIYQHFPRVDNLAFQNDMFQKNVLHSVLYKQEDKDTTLDTINKNMYGIIGSLSVSLGLIIFHNKIPLLRRVQSKWKKFFTKFFILMLPVQAASFYGSIKIEQENFQFYTKYFPEYVKFKQTGDVRALSQTVKLQD